MIESTAVVCRTYGSTTEDVAWQYATLGCGSCGSATGTRVVVVASSGDVMVVVDELGGGTVVVDELGGGSVAVDELDVGVPAGVADEDGGTVGVDAACTAAGDAASPTATNVAMPLLRNAPRIDGA